MGQDEESYFTMEIAQVKCELSVIGEGLVGATFANLRSRSVEIISETGTRKFTSSQYKGVRPSIADWDRMIRCTRISSYVELTMREISGRFKSTHLMKSFHRGGPRKSPTRTQGVCGRIQGRNNDQVARRGAAAEGRRQCLKTNRVSECQSESDGNELGVPQLRG